MGPVIEWSPPMISGSSPAPTTSPTVCSIAAWLRYGCAGTTAASQKSTIRKPLERVDAGLQMRPGRATRGTDRARGESRTRTVGNELVHGRADDRDVEAGELGRVLRAGDAAERERARVVGLLPILPPALHRVEHRRVNLAA